MEWQQYLAAPTNTAKKAAVTTKLQAMLRALMGLAEYHLASSFRSSAQLILPL